MFKTVSKNSEQDKAYHPHRFIPILFCPRGKLTLHTLKHLFIFRQIVKQGFVDLRENSSKTPLTKPFRGVQAWGSSEIVHCSLYCCGDDSPGFWTHNQVTVPAPHAWYSEHQLWVRLSSPVFPDCHVLDVAEEEQEKAACQQWQESKKVQ